MSGWRLAGVVLLSLFIVIWLLNIFVFGYSGLFQLTNPVFIASLIGLIVLVAWRKRH